MMVTLDINLTEVPRKLVEAHFQVCPEMTGIQVSKWWREDPLESEWYHPTGNWFGWNKEQKEEAGPQNKLHPF